MAPINLDCVNEYELRSIALDKRVHPLQAAYAANRMRAIRARLTGRIQDASVIETTLESQYRRMPEGIRW